MPAVATDDVFCGFASGSKLLSDSHAMLLVLAEYDHRHAAANGDDDPGGVVFDSIDQDLSRLVLIEVTTTHLEL